MKIDLITAAKTYVSAEALCTIPLKAPVSYKVGHIKRITKGFAEGYSEERDKLLKLYADPDKERVGVFNFKGKDDEEIEENRNLFKNEEKLLGEEEIEVDIKKGYLKMSDFAKSNGKITPETEYHDIKGAILEGLDWLLENNV